MTATGNPEHLVRLEGLAGVGGKAVAATTALQAEDLPVIVDLGFLGGKGEEMMLRRSAINGNDRSCIDPLRVPDSTG